MVTKNIKALLVTAVFALSVVPATTLAHGNHDTKKYDLPSNAVKISDTVYDLGYKKDPKTGKEVKGYAFVTPKVSAQKKSGGGGKKGSDSGVTSCYALFGSGVKWNTAEPWVIDPSNTQGLDENQIISTVNKSIATWENAAEFNIFGNGSVASNLSADLTGGPDGQNEFVFGDIEDPNVMAYTVTWGVFSGSPKKRHLSEWDQIFDQNEFNWSLSGESVKMDFESVVTHEFGHAPGLDHVSEDACKDETMYPYTSLGETKKRTLEAGDIAGIKELY